jgi:hypothetical protein
MGVNPLLRVRRAQMCKQATRIEPAGGLLFKFCVGLKTAGNAGDLTSQSAIVFVRRVVPQLPQ